MWLNDVYPHLFVWVLFEKLLRVQKKKTSHNSPVCDVHVVALHLDFRCKMEENKGNVNPLLSRWGRQLAPDESNAQRFFFFVSQFCLLHFLPIIEVHSVSLFAYLRCTSQVFITSQSADKAWLCNNLYPLL